MRPYEGQKDLKSMIAMVSDRPPERVTDYPSIIDLNEMLGPSGPRDDVQLWEDGGGALVGFAILDYTDNLRFEIRPGAASGDIAAQMISWGLERVRQSMRQESEHRQLLSSCRDSYVERAKLLERAGFARQEWYTMQLVRSLAEHVPEPVAPEGFVVRAVAGEHEAGVLAALHRAAFGTEHVTVEDRLSWMRTPEYDPELDLVAVAPDGTLAAYALLHVSPQENALCGRLEGHVGSLGTHPAFQRMGLARVLLLAGLVLLKRRGLETACTSTGCWNLAMQRAARSVGFQTEGRTLFFLKSVDAASHSGSQRIVDGTTQKPRHSE